MADDTPRVLFEFTGADAAKEWQTVNDGVMGGVSEGKFKITDAKTLEFFGNLSLENNGGFASVRTKAKKLGLEKGDTLVAKVRGDGREYSLNLYVSKRCGSPSRTGPLCRRRRASGSRSKSRWTSSRRLRSAGRCWTPGR